MGSSSIRRVIIEGLTGSTGPTGPVGPRGSTGTGTGKTGETGPLGYYFTSIDYDSAGNPIIYSNGLVPFCIVYGLTGATGYTQNLGGSTLGTNYFILNSFTGGTLNIYGLSFAGILSSTVNNETILVTVQDQTAAITVASGSEPLQVAYAKDNDEISTTRIKSNNNEFSFSELNGISHTSTFLDSSFVVATVPSVPQENLIDFLNNYENISPYILGVDSSKGIYLNVLKSSVFVINTPIGIAGFSLSANLYSETDIVSFTMFVNGSEIWSFPSNVYFENQADSSYFGCGMNIMNLTSYDKGQSWIARVSDIGYGVTGCNDFDSLGSCCYNDAEGNFECDDYRTKGFCDRVNGLFRSSTTCAQSCGTTLNTICCSEGRCVDNISEDECEFFGGKFYATSQPLSCSEDNIGNNMERLCYDKCQDPVVCCKNGICLGEMTKKICERVYGGRGITGTCDTVDCCKEIPFFGACCETLADNTTKCTEEFIYDCKSTQNKTFMGHGSQCVNSTTCCSAGQTYEGICCVHNQSCVGTNRFTCENVLFGNFYEGEFDCETCANSPCYLYGDCNVPGCPPCGTPNRPAGCPCCSSSDPECTRPCYRCIYEQRGFYAIPVGCIEYRTSGNSCSLGNNGGCDSDVCQCASNNPGCWTIPPRPPPGPPIIVPPIIDIQGFGGGDDDDDEEEEEEGGGGEGRPPIIGSPPGGAFIPPSSTVCNPLKYTGTGGWTLPRGDPGYTAKNCEAAPFGTPGGGNTNPDGGCKCPSYPINGWMFNAGCTSSGFNPNGGSNRCICLRGNRDPNVLKFFPGLPPDLPHGATSDAYPNGICEDKFGWKEIRQGFEGGVTGPPDSIPCCCPSPPPASGPTVDPDCKYCCNHPCYCKPFWEQRNPCEDCQCCSTCFCDPPNNTERPGGLIRFDATVDAGTGLVITCAEECICEQCQSCFISSNIGDDPCAPSALCLVCGGIKTCKDPTNPSGACQQSGAVGIPFVPTAPPPTPPAVYHPPSEKQLKDPFSQIVGLYYCGGPFNPCDNSEYI